MEKGFDFLTAYLDARDEMEVGSFDKELGAHVVHWDAGKLVELRDRILKKKKEKPIP